MGVLSVLNELRTKSLLAFSLLLTSIVLGNGKEFSSVDQQTTFSASEIEQLTFCGDKIGDEAKDSRLVYISTLDGKLSALDVLHNGDLKFTVNTGPGTLLSSSIHQLELTNNGQWVRMIPSLSGGLYQFDGDSVEPIPITATNLLDSSFKFSDDLVISGGKETRTYGVSSKSGQLLYECSMHGCKNLTETESGHQNSNSHNPVADDVLIVRRQTQTVRAIEPRTGNERWNFSVGHHELDLIKSENCHNKVTTDIEPLDFDIKVIVPEGLVCAVSKTDPRTVLWSHKFDFPIVSAWQEDEGEAKHLKAVDLFTTGRSEYLTNPEFASLNDRVLAPSLYVGMFNQQLYIQESELLSNLIHGDKKLLDSNVKYPRIPWKPFPATGSGLLTIEPNEDDTNSDRALMTISDTELAPAVRQSVLYETGYVNGNGFFLYTADDLNKSEHARCDTDETTDQPLDLDEELTFPDEETPARVMIVSLWFWWKEIMVIAITTAIILNMFLARKVRSEKEVIFIERHVEVPVTKDSSSVELSSRGSQRSLSESNNGENFNSRFLTDFDLVRCLGKGGFGVVFEVRNKLDDCNYAIKRIVLPSKKESRDRVMREVKTLANCEHQNIVRYYQAWVEHPPMGWQEKQDSILFERDALSTSIDIGTPTESHPPSSYPVKSQPQYHINNEVLNRNKLDSWITHLNTDECINFDDEIRRTKFSFNNNDDDSSSFIQFKNDSENDESISVFDPPRDARHVDDSFEIEFLHSNGQPASESYTNDKDKMTSGGTTTGTESELFTNESEKKIVPFKKTHRRPQSLDLTSKGKVVAIPPTNKMYLYIQMQLCRKQSLRDWLRDNNLVQRSTFVLSIFEQIVGAVEYVHLKGLIHRDLKPSNIFFALDGQIRIGDFGLVTDMSDIPNLPADEDNGFISSKHTELVGTHLYMSPEQLQGKNYNYKVDIFSLGLIFFELLVVFSTEMERIQTLKQLRNNEFPDDFQKDFNKEFELLKLMLAASPKDRPTTFGIRARLQDSVINADYHFELPPRRFNSRTGSISISNSSHSIS